MSCARSMMPLAALAALAVVASGAAPATADDAPGVGDSESSTPAGRTAGGSAVESPDGAATAKVTLITGDRVWLTRSRDSTGQESVSARVEPATRPAGRKVSFATWGTAEKYYVVPSDVLPLLGSRVDADVFDVAGLIDTGANKSPTTRVIVSFKNAAASGADGLRPRARALIGRVGAVTSTELTSANAVALAVKPGKAGALFDQVAEASSSVASVDLDARVKALDTTSMPQIGAPTAWKAGYTGKGVKVAVLDTGIDATHPDLKGQVVAEKNFGDSDSNTDRNGHGTHVASIIAGTGAASNPAMRGVAYESTLFNVKVLDDGGSGYSSDVIAGMEWAAENGADVINMSLGSGPGDGTDPTERSVNDLSKRYGTVFAIAAGNSGEYGAGLVSSPSTADAAISVAAVDSANAHASFSDSGPRPGDSGLKPDVAAPGVDILGARSRVNDFGPGSSPYVKLSGTSMATPHVAGAAAVLAQARPELSGAELKSALMGGATKQRGTVWQDGAGTINIPDSIGMPVIAAEGSLSFGVFAYPQANLKPVAKTIHYRNPGTTAIRLSLRKDVTSATGHQARGVSLSKTSVLVPAGGSAAVRVTVRPAANGLGLYAGAITATPSTGQAIRTTIGWNAEPQLFNLTIKAIDRGGLPAKAIPVLFNVRNGRKPLPAPYSFEKSTTLRVPPGDYLVGAYIWPSVPTPLGSDGVMSINPEAKVAGDTTVTLGGPSAKKLQVSTPRPARMTDAAYFYRRVDARKSTALNMGVDFGPNFEHAWVTPTASATLGTAQFVETGTLVGTDPQAAYDYRLAYLTNGRIPSTLSHTLSPKRVAASVGTYRWPPTSHKMLITWTPTFKDFGTVRGQWLSHDLPTTATTYLAGNASWYTETSAPAGWADWTYTPKPAKYAPGSTTRRDYFTAVMSPAAVSAGRAYRRGERLVVNLADYEDSEGRYVSAFRPSVKGTFTAYVGAKKLASSSSGNQLNVRLPAGKTLRLVQRADRKRDWWQTSTSVTGEWTAPVPTKGAPVVSLLNVQYRLRGQSMTGAVPPGKQTIGLTVTGFTNPKNFGTGTIEPKALKLEWSVDGGTTWQRATLDRQGKKATATFSPPKSATKVSLRATASDGKGSSVRETIVSAYELTASAPQESGRAK